MVDYVGPITEYLHVMGTSVCLSEVAKEEQHIQLLSCYRPC